jgi:hypothetical protein
MPHFKLTNFFAISCFFADIFHQWILGDSVAAEPEETRTKRRVFAERISVQQQFSITTNILIEIVDKVQSRHWVYVSFPRRKDIDFIMSQEITSRKT